MNAPMKSVWKEALARWGTKEGHLQIWPEFRSIAEQSEDPLLKQVMTSPERIPRENLAICIAILMSRNSETLSKHITTISDILQEMGTELDDAHQWQQNNHEPHLGLVSKVLLATALQLKSQINLQSLQFSAWVVSSHLVSVTYRLKQIFQTDHQAPWKDWELLLTRFIAQARAINEQQGEILFPALPQLQSLLNAQQEPPCS